MTTLAPCWDEVELLHILKPDAEEIDDRVFRAVHCPTELQVRVGDWVSGTLMPRSPEDLLNEFLDPHRNYVQMAVVGESGTGKSHFIQWLRLNIPPDASTVLLTIPRTGTSLRGIIERIIAQLPEKERAPYEERLRTAGNHAMTQAAKVSRFLNELAHAIEHSNICTDPLDQDLASVLPNIFLDPNLRAGFFTQPGGTTDLIVQHIFSDPSSRDHDDRRRDFRMGDLPLDGRSYGQVAAMSKEAIDFIKGEHGMEQRAINLMNAHRNIAIAQTLNFSADHLIELMNTLRRHLKQQGKRLILLIEDFARVQGIDTALLQALITPPSQGAEKLCELRWAMAVTTGPYTLLEATVRSRATIVIDMDHSQPASLERLTAGYLNALRLGMNRLEQLPVAETPASRCGSCQHKEKCLGAFGSVDGIGLFPFTQTAVNVMARRSGSRNADGSFNARRYMGSVLEAVLKHHYGDLSQGEFPSAALVRRIGGTSTLTPAQKQTIQETDSAFSERRIALLELWSGKGDIANLDPGIHAAFGIGQLSGAVTDSDAKGEDTPETTIGGSPDIVHRLPTHVATLRKWANGEMVMPSPVVNELRVLVFGAVESYIDWDMLGMEKTAVASATATKVAFRQSSINFESQQTQRLPTLVSFDLPRGSGLALEALLSFKHYQHWDFPDGVQLLTNLMDFLEQWSAEVKRQLLGLFGPKKGWQPVTATAELLAIAHYACGKVKLDTASEALAVQIWGKSQLTPATHSSSGLKKIAEKLADKVPLLFEFLRAHSSGTKGGTAGNFVRMGPVSAAVRSLRMRALALHLVPPENAESPEVQAISDLYRFVKENLPAAIEEERQERSVWYQSVVQDLGAETKVVTLVGILRELINDAVDKSIHAGHTRAQLNDLLNELKPNSLDAAITHGAAIAEVNNTEVLVRSAIIGANASTLTLLIERAGNFVQAVDEYVDNRRHQLEQQAGAGLTDSEARIAGAIDDIVQALEAVALLPRNEYEPA